MTESEDIQYILNKDKFLEIVNNISESGNYTLDCSDYTFYKTTENDINFLIFLNLYLCLSKYNDKNSDKNQIYKNLIRKVKYFNYNQIEQYVYFRILFE